MDREKCLNENETVESQNSVENVTKRILKADGNGLRLSLSTLFCMLFAFALLVLCLLPPIFFVYYDSVEIELISYVEALVSIMCTFLLLLGFVFLILPCISGIVCFAKSTVDGEKPYFIKIFAPFRSGRLYFRSILVPIVIFVRTLIIALPVFGGFRYLSFYFYDGFSFATLADMSYVICTTFAAVAVAAYVASYLFFVPYLLISHNKGFFASISESFRLSRGRRFEITKMTMRGFFDVIISALSFMVLFVIYAMPRMSVSYFVYCNSVVMEDDAVNNNQ